MKDTPGHFVAALESLWTVMDGGGYAPHLNATLKKFNGSLFKKRAALPLDKDDINELWIVNRRSTGTPYRHPKGTPLIGVLCW
ncbi:hypothetical protein ACVIGA_004094 [Bradyrhizobium sp. USDA 3240]